MIRTQMATSPAGAVLTVLQRKGTATIKELEDSLGVTANAVRQQVTSLLADDYIEQRTEHLGRGRPRNVYSLTDRGLALFPRHYDELTHTLLHEILLTEGPQKVQLLLERMSQRLAAQYSGQIESIGPEERARELIELLNAKGILAEVHANSKGFVFQEYNCPYYELARQYRAICDMEQGMISHVLQQPVALVACSLDGHHGCHFSVDDPAKMESTSIESQENS
jgi:DeoR family suf operon transcriptional repressor